MAIRFPPAPSPPAPPPSPASFVELLEAIRDEAQSVADDAADLGRELKREGQAAADKARRDVEAGAGRIMATADRAAKRIRLLVPGAIGPSRAAEPYRERSLTQAERDLARSVFGGSLPLGAIVLSNRTGAGDRQYAIPHPARLGSWVIHAGAEIFEDATRHPGDETFIHELVHVWQSAHGPNPFDYLVHWLHQRITVGDEQSYAFVAGQAWASYGVEQQAAIVETWYRDGRVESDTDPLFCYIRDNIRLSEPG